MTTGLRTAVILASAIATLIAPMMVLSPVAQQTMLEVTCAETCCQATTLPDASKQAPASSKKSCCSHATSAERAHDSCSPATNQGASPQIAANSSDQPGGHHQSTNQGSDCQGQCPCCSGLIESVVVACLHESVLVLPSDLSANLVVPSNRYASCSLEVQSPVPRLL